MKLDENLSFTTIEGLWVLFILPCALGYKFQYITLKNYFNTLCIVTDIKLDLDRGKEEENSLLLVNCTKCKLMKNISVSTS